MRNYLKLNILLDNYVTILNTRIQKKAFKEQNSYEEILLCKYIHNVQKFSFEDKTNVMF